MLELLALLGSAAAGTGAATAGTAGSAAIPSLLGGSFLSSVLPGILSSGAVGSIPGFGPSMAGGAASSAVPLAGMMASPTPGSALQEALQVAGLSGGAGMKAPAGMAGAAPAVNQPGATNQIPLLPELSGWEKALSNTATVQDMMLKHQAMNRIPNAPAPSLRSTATPVPKLGTPLPAPISPMQRFAMMLRSM